MSNAIEVARPSATPAVAPAPSPGITRDEKERRLWFVADRMLQGVHRTLLVGMCMSCFGVGRRAAQKYVQKAERRLRDGGATESPFFYLQLSKLQRDHLLAPLFRIASRPDELSPKLLADLALAANRVLDSRDRAAYALFRFQQAAGLQDLSDTRPDDDRCAVDSSDDAPPHLALPGSRTENGPRTERTPPTNDHDAS
jgi:hypothetical protein